MCPPRSISYGHCGLEPRHLTRFGMHGSAPRGMDGGSDGLEDERGLGVEPFEEPRVENDTGRAAVAPLDAPLPSRNDHRPLSGSLPRSGPSPSQPAAGITKFDHDRFAFRQIVPGVMSVPSASRTTLSLVVAPLTPRRDGRQKGKRRLYRPLQARF